jgi:hypothetical protein
MPSNLQNIQRLQQALNSKGCKILYSSSQFWSEEMGRPIKMYKIEQAISDPESKKGNKKVKLFETSSQIQVVLFLRDMWNEVNGLPVDTSNPVWNEIKSKVIDK